MARKAEQVAAARRVEEERERVRKASAEQKRVEELARCQEECRRQRAEWLAEEERRREAEAEAARVAKEQKEASVEAYLNWQKKISQRDPKETLRVQMSAPEEIPYSTDGGMRNFKDRGFSTVWRKSSKGWRKG
jgi:colicin import membrane protein